MIGFGSLKQSRALLNATARERRRDPRYDHHDNMSYVTLADGTTMAVPRANLAAAKALLAAQKAAERRVAQALTEAERDTSGELAAMGRW